MGVPDEISDFILAEQNNKGEIFAANPQNIFTSTKEDIISFCNQIDIEYLKEIREHLFTKLGDDNGVPQIPHTLRKSQSIKTYSEEITLIDQDGKPVNEKSDKEPFRR